MRKFYYLFLLLLPLLLVITAVFLNDARGPFWLGTNLDPEYVYLLNGANLAGLKGVGHIDHPGTPVQVLGAMTLRTVHFFQFSLDVDLQTDVLKRPEYYLKAINTVMVILNTIMLLALGVFAFLTTKNIWLSLWLQLAPFFSITVLQFGLTRVTPEPLLFFSSLMLVLLLVVKLHSDKDAKQRENVLMAILFALVTGFGIACKVTFIPMVVIPLFLLPKLKNKVFYLVGVGISFVIFTLPIIRMYPRFFDWIYNLLSHSGHYGSGASGLVASHKYMRNIIKLLSGNPFFSVVLVFSLVIVIVVLLIPKLRRVSASDIHFKMLGAVAAAQVAGLLMVSKHSANHYLLPVLSLSGLSLYLVYYLVKSFCGGSEPAGVVFSKSAPFIGCPRRGPAGGIILLIVMFIIINPPRQVKKAIGRLGGLQEKSLLIHQEVENNYKDYAKIYYYRSSSPEYALKFGSDLSRSYHAQRLEELYKGVYFYDIWTKRFSGFDYNRKISFKEIKARHGDKILFQGTRGIKMPGLKLENLSNIRFSEGIFKKGKK